MNRRVSIYQDVPTQDAATGELVANLVELSGSPIWAAMLSRIAGEKVLGRELVSESAVVWEARYLATVTAKMVLVYGGKAYRIEGVHENPSMGIKVGMFLETTVEEPVRADA